MYESPSIYKAGYKILYKTESGQEGTDLLSGSVEYETSRGLQLWAAGEIHGKMITAVNDSTPSEDNEYGLRVAAARRIESFSFFSLLERIGNFDGMGGVRSIHGYSEDDISSVRSGTSGQNMSVLQDAPI